MMNPAIAASWLARSKCLQLCALTQTSILHTIGKAHQTLYIILCKFGDARVNLNHWPNMLFLAIGLGIHPAPNRSACKFHEVGVFNIDAFGNTVPLRQ